MNKQRIEWFKKKLENHKEYNDVKYISEPREDTFGTLEGVSFNNDQRGGYIYFWSSGYINYEIYDYEKDKSILDIKMIEVLNNEDLEVLLEDFLKNL